MELRKPVTNDRYLISAKISLDVAESTTESFAVKALRHALQGSQESLLRRLSAPDFDMRKCIINNRLIVVNKSENFGSNEVIVVLLQQ